MIATRPSRGVRIHVHEDARALETTQALVELANRSQPLEDSLCAMCRRVAQIAAADVVSVYLREADTLVLRGNVGFPAHALRRVSLKLHDGLIGVVAERRRPVTVANGQHDRRYKHVDGIGEEQFPAFLGVPLLDAGEVVGVLVVQRRRPYRFTPADIALASSLTAPFIFAIRRDAPAGCSGVARLVPAGPVQLARITALHALELDLAATTHRLRAPHTPEVARSLENLALVTQALRDDGCDDAVAALERVPFRAVSGAKALGTLFDQRRTELADLVSFVAADLQLAGGVLVVPRLGALVALEAVARGAVGVIAGAPISVHAGEVLRTAGVPAVGGHPELVASLRGGELLEIDEARGSVRVVTT
jgi:putative methionine-R-sulfoxide reductase with GAF domain/phosphohistidine swiveling domain-containing protein